MALDSEKVVPISTNEIIPLIKINFNKEDIEKIKASVSAMRSDPLIVRRKRTKYQLCSSPEIFEALNQLGVDPIDCIVRDINEQEGRELTLASILPHTELSPKEIVNIVWETYESGNYKSHAEFAEKIGKSDTWVIDRCYAKKQCEILALSDVTSDCISIETYRLIRPLSDDNQKLFCDRIEDGEIKKCETRDCVKFLNDESLPEGLKQAVLDGETRWRQAKRFWDSRQPGIKAITDALKEYHNPETYQIIIENEQPNYTSEPYRLLGEFTNTITVNSVKNIKDKNKIKQVERNLRIAGTQIFNLLYELGVIDENQYNEICTISETPPDIIKDLKEDGQYYFFKDSWLTDTEKKLKERIDKILNGKEEPLLR